MLKILIFSLLSLSVFAETAVGIVLITKGDASVLLPGTKQAVQVTKGLKVPEDSSILTGDKGYLVMAYQDGTKITVGPNSKIVTTKILSKEEPGSISILKGQIRASVDKVNKAQGFNNKLFLRTRTVSMGVRGTDFMIVFNPDNNTSSLLTFEGEVAVIKDAGEVSSQELDKLLSNSTISAKEKEFVGLTTNELVKTTDIDNNQFETLKNENVSKISLLDVIETEAVSANDKIIDFKTALVVPSSAGKVDRITGVFVAPKGTELTAKGFKPSDKESSKDESKARELNVLLGKSPKFYSLGLSVEQFAFRSTITDGSGTLEVIDTASFKTNLVLKLHTSSLNYTHKFGMVKISPDSAKCEFCEINSLADFEKDLTLFSYSFAVEKNFSTFLKYGATASMNERPLINKENVSSLEKNKVLGLGLFARENLYSTNKTNFYTGQEVQLSKGSESEIGMQFKLSVGGENKTGAIGFFYELQYSQESYKSNDGLDYNNDTMGIALGLNFDF